jgi:hypothetical protein
MAAAGGQEKAAKKPRLGDIQSFIDDINVQYEKVHVAFEEQFWGCKMGLQNGTFSTALLSSTKEAMEAWLRSPENKTKVDALLASGAASAEQKKVLECFQRTFSCYQMSDLEAVSLRADCTKIEDKLNAGRNSMALGYTDPSSGEFIEKSSVGLRTIMKTADDEATRKAAWEGLRSLGPWVVSNGFCDMVKLRNAMARKLGYEDFYDYKVTQAEGFGKAKLFSILDTLLEGSESLLASARKQLSSDKGAAALQGWNVGYMMAGDVEKQLDPYFPFEHSVEQWGRCFAKLGISYEGASMTLDLLDRKGKYSNGFCHWPQPAWVRSDGSWQPSTTNFTSLADPAAVGSGRTALTTLMHEAGHAAHFANIKQRSPLFSQERAPTSVAYAENQSMFLDSLCADAAWRARYARNRQGAPLPWAVHEQELRSTFPFRVFALRSMLSVPYFEKALYELADDQVTAEAIQALADRVEHAIQGGLAARPMLSVPHIISDEASCYYHGYVLAEMSVHQTRQHFLKTLDVPIVDNPMVGAVLTDSYWKPGNSTPFLDLVEGLTGAPLTGAPWLEDLRQDLETLVASEKEEYAKAVAAVAAQGPTDDDGEVDLKMRMIIKDGDVLIADSEQSGGFLPATKIFAEYVTKRFAKM